jgi:flagellin-like protein
MKKGITPIIAVIILLLITVALAGLAWTFLSGYFTGLTGKTIQVSDFFCMGGVNAQITITNTGTETISLGTTGTCDTAGSITGVSESCGDITITRTDGANMHGDLGGATTVRPGGTVVFNDSCWTGSGVSTCSYRIVGGSSGIGPNTATVSCAG